jgi:hypothetical protein
MAALTGQYISQSYGGVINFSTNTGIVTGSFTQLQDGLGTNLGVFFNGQGIISGSAVRATSFTGSFNGSLFGTASYASTSSFVGPTLNQNLTISGSTAGVVKALTISSQTASMDLSTADLFTLTLVSGSNTFLNPTNIKAGQTGILQITQPATFSTLSYPSSIKFPAFLAYTASVTSSAVDQISFVAFNTSSLNAVAANKFS